MEGTFSRRIFIISIWDSLSLENTTEYLLIATSAFLAATYSSEVYFDLLYFGWKNEHCHVLLETYPVSIAHRTSSVRVCVLVVRYIF